jgi:hypothetical protein
VLQHVDYGTSEDNKAACTLHVQIVQLQQHGVEFATAVSSTPAALSNESLTTGEEAGGMKPNCDTQK